MWDPVVMRTQGVDINQWLGLWFSHFMKNELNNYYAIGILSNIKHVHTYMLRQNHGKKLLNYNCSLEGLRKWC